MLKIIGIVVVVFVAGVLIFAATQPGHFRVQRQVVVKAPADKILPLITDLHGWTAWSPYEKKDPAMKRTFGGAERGKGATYAWDGNKEVGAGRMEITDVTPAQVKIDLVFLRPMEARNVATFALEPKGDSTIVEWAMDGPQPFLGKIVCLFFDMDKMVGTDFEAGLASLKALAEK
jgi:Polyketide cyclase / dehydrase and lipid transport